MIFKDYYKILGLNTNKVSTEEIKSAYREQAKKYHPDVNVGSEERFKDINEAYNTLSNTSTKRKYDRMWNSKIGKKKSKITNKKTISTKGELLNILFGNLAESSEKNKKINKNEKIPKQGENVETEIQVTIQDAFFGVKKEISLRTISGTMKTFEVAIPAGIRSGEKIRLIGQGLSGENGGKNGDLLIKINIEKSNKYELIGTDIYTQIPISPWEAVLGTKINIQLLDETIGVFIPQCTTTGKEIRIPQKGYKDGKGGRGDLIIKTKIMISEKITTQEKDLYKKLEKISKFKPRREYD